MNGDAPPQNTADKRITAAFRAQAGKGRPKGVPNKATATMKAAIQAVYDKLQQDAGEAHGHFFEWAKSEPTEFYKLAAKLIPIQVGSDPDNPLPSTISVHLITSAPAK